MVYTKNTWRTNDIITADKLNNMENGIDFQNTKEVTFTDFATAASDMAKYAGSWFSDGKNILNSPIAGVLYGVIEVSPAYGSRTGTIRYSDIPEWRNGFYQTAVDNGKVVGWHKIADDSNVVHKIGDETLSGNKSFTGNVSIAGSVMNYATIPSLSITGYVSGSLKVSKQSGIVSITSMDLVLTKGATLTMPGGYYPRSQLQAPITGQNSTGTTAGGYMTIGIDGSVTFNSMGFASGNATAYVNVHYIAQV